MGDGAPAGKSISMETCCNHCNLAQAAQAQCQSLLLNNHTQQYMGTYITSVCAAGTPAGSSSPSSFYSSVISLTRLPPTLEARNVQLPALRCSFPALLHPLYELVKEQCDGWILHVAQPPSPAVSQLLLDCVLPRLICRNIPTPAASVARLVHVTKMVSWLTIADDDDDHPQALGADDVNTSSNAIQVLSILRGRPCRSTSSEEGCTSVAPAGHLQPLPSITHTNSTRREKKEIALLALSALWAEMHTEMGERLCSRFVCTMEDYFDAVKVQATYRKANLLPDMEAYKEIRRQACFILPCLVLMEYALGIELDDATHAGPRLKELRNAVTDYIWLCNDLVSCNVEIGVGDYFNMPSIVYSIARGPHDKGWTLQGAVDSVADMTRVLEAECASRLEAIQDELLQAAVARHSYSGISAPAATLTYLAGLRSCMSGSLAWYLETARYAQST